MRKDDLDLHNLDLYMLNELELKQFQLKEGRVLVEIDREWIIEYL